MIEVYFIKKKLSIKFMFLTREFAKMGEICSLMNQAVLSLISYTYILKHL